MGQTVFPAYSLVGGGKQWLAPTANAPAVGCALLDYGPHPSIANTRLLDWSARPVLQTPAVAAGSGTDYFAGDGTWKPYTPTTPAGSGTELQYRNGSSFGAVTGSSVSGGNVTIGGKITLQPAGSSFNDTIFRVNRPDLSEAAKIHIYNDGGGSGGYVNLSLGTSAIAGNITLGRGGGLTLTDDTANRWMFYTANSTSLYLFDYTNARMHIYLVPGTTATAQTFIDGQVYTIGNTVEARGTDNIARSVLYPNSGAQRWTSGTSYVEISPGAAGVNTHASLSLVTSLGSANLFNWHANGKTYLDASGEFELRTAGVNRFRITAAGRTQINGAIDSGWPLTVKGAASFESSASTSQNIIIQPDNSQILLYSALGNTTLFNYSGDGRTYLDSSGFVLRSNGVEAVTGFGSGRVFIGAPGSDPGARFTVGGNTSFQGNVDVTGTLSAAVFEPTYLRIPGTSAVTGTNVLATIGDNSIGFSGTNDADSKHLIEHKACSYMVNGGGIVNYTGVRYGMIKEGTWNLGSGGTQVGAAFVVETSSGGSLVSLPTLTERFRIRSDGFTAVNGNFRATSAGFGTDPISGYGAVVAGNTLISGGFLNVAGNGYYLGSVDIRGTDYVTRVYADGNTGTLNAAGLVSADRMTLSGSVDGTSARLNLYNTSTGGNGASITFSSNASTKYGLIGFDGTGNMVVQSDSNVSAGMYFDHGGAGVLFRDRATYSNWLRLSGNTSTTYIYGGSDAFFFNNATGVPTNLYGKHLQATNGAVRSASSIYGYISQFALNEGHASTEFYNSYPGDATYSGWKWRNGTATVVDRMALSGAGVLYVTDSVHTLNEFRLNGGASYSRVAHLDGAGGFGGGYNFNMNSSIANRDSTGTVSGYHYSGSYCKFFAEGSGSPGAINPKLQIGPSVTYTINALEVYGTAGANKLAVWNNATKDYLRFAIDSDTGEATFAGNSGNMFIRPYGGAVQLIGNGYLNICTTYTDMVFVTNHGGATDYPLTFQNANSVFGGHITSKYQTLSVDPTTSDVPSGSQRMVHNSTSGTTKLWANVGGTMKSIALT